MAHSHQCTNLRPHSRLFQRRTQHLHQNLMDVESAGRHVVRAMAIAAPIVGSAGPPLPILRRFLLQRALLHIHGQYRNHSTPTDPPACRNRVQQGLQAHPAHQPTRGAATDVDDKSDQAYRLVHLIRAVLMGRARQQHQCLWQAIQP